MTADALIAARVSPDTKRLWARLCAEDGLSESAYLKRMVERAIEASGLSLAVADVVACSAHDGRLSLRLRMEDLKVLRERAAGRQMPVSTYVAWLLRAHVRDIAPMPPSELAAFKRAVAELGAIGRNLNQLIRAIHRGEANTSLSKADLLSILRVISALRDHMKSVVTANQDAWRMGA